MLLLIPFLSLIHYPAFSIPSSGMRLSFNPCATAGIMVDGTCRAGIRSNFVYNIVTHIVALACTILYMRLVCLGMDVRLCDPELANRSNSGGNETGACLKTGIPLTEPINTQPQPT